MKQHELDALSRVSQEIEHKIDLLESKLEWSTDPRDEALYDAWFIAYESVSDQLIEATEPAWRFWLDHTLYVTITTPLLMLCLVGFFALGGIDMETAKHFALQIGILAIIVSFIHAFWLRNRDVISEAIISRLPWTKEISE